MCHEPYVLIRPRVSASVCREEDPHCFVTWKNRAYRIIEWFGLKGPQNSSVPSPCPLLHPVVPSLIQPGSGHLQEFLDTQEKGDKSAHKNPNRAWMLWNFICLDTVWKNTMHSQLSIYIKQAYTFGYIIIDVKLKIIKKWNHYRKTAASSENFATICFHRRLLKSISCPSMVLVVILFYIISYFYNTFSLGTHSEWLHTNGEDKVLEEQQIL